MKKVMAADIGGSKTLIRIYSPDGKIVGQVTGEGAGLATDELCDIPALSQLIRSIPDLETVAGVAVNLGGKNKRQIEAIFRSALPHAKVAVFRESEGNAAFELCEEYGAQVVVLAGTGSIAVGRGNDGSCVIAGGWGALIGDEGSGYYIGQLAVRRSLIELDGNTPLSALARELTGLDAPLDCRNADEYCTMRDGVRARLAPLERKNIASFTKTVGRLADEGDEVSKEILADAGEKLADLAISAGKKLAGIQVRRVVVTGGLVNIADHWKSSFEARLGQELGTEGFHYLADGIMHGTYMAALKL